MIGSKPFTILDCTLRDGGFYNNWDFADPIIKNYLNVISNTGIDIVEIGYRSINIMIFKVF